MLPGSLGAVLPDMVLAGPPGVGFLMLATLMLPSLVQGSQSGTPGWPYYSRMQGKLLHLSCEDACSGNLGRRNSASMTLQSWLPELYLVAHGL